MAQQSVQFDAPAEVKFDAPAEVKFDAPAVTFDQPAKTNREGLAHKVLSRLVEPLREEEVERVPGLESDRAEMLRTKFTKYGIPEAPETSWFNLLDPGTRSLYGRAMLKSLTDWYSPVQMLMHGTKYLPAKFAHLAPVIQTAAGAGFASKQGIDLYENWGRMSPIERLSSLAGVVGGALMTGVGLHSTAKSQPAPKSQVPLTQQDHLAYKYNLVPQPEFAGEHGRHYRFVDPVTGGSLSVPKAGFGESGLREAVDKLRSIPREELHPVLRTGATDKAAHVAGLNERFRREYVDRLPDKVGFFRYWLGQPVETMRESGIPEMQRVGELISNSEVDKSRWFHAAIGQVTNALTGLNGRSINHVGEIIDRWTIPHAALGQRSNRTGELFTQQEVQSAIHARVQLLNIWEQLNAASGRALGPFRLGFIQNYLPHLEKINMPERVLNAIKAEVAGEAEEPPSRRYVAEPTTERRGRGLTQFLLRRNRKIPDAQLEYDLRKVLPSYLRGVSRVLFDRQAILHSEELLETMPENSTWRQFGDAYLDRYTYKMSHKEYDVKARRLARMLMNTGTRSVLGFSPRLQTLHLARLLTSVWPEMNSRDFAYGLAKVARDPVGAYRRAAEVGILPQTVPLQYMSGWRKFDAFANYLGAADFIDRTVAYEGQYHRYLREGLTPDEALHKAAIDSKNFSFLSSPAHSPLAFGRGSASGFLDAVSSMSLQYKHIPTSILYQFAKAMRRASQDPTKAAKFLFALSTAGAIQYKTGVHLLHFATNVLTGTGTYLGSVMQRAEQQFKAAYQWYAKGNEHKAFAHLAAAIEGLSTLFPGGFQIYRARRYGLKGLIMEPSDAEKKRLDRQWRQEHR